MPAHYGRVDLSIVDIEYLKSGLCDVRRTLSDNHEAAADPDERQFYADGLMKSSTIAKRLETMEPGMLGFSENELTWLRSVLGYESTRPLLHKYEAAKNTNSDRAAELLNEIAFRQTLADRLEQPFRLDTSQDAEEENEEIDTFSGQEPGFA